MTTKVSPSTGAKHERSEDEDEETRRVAQRIDETEDEGADDETCPLTSIKDCIIGISRSNDTDYVRDSLMLLSNSLDKKKISVSKKTKQEVFVNVGGPLVIVNVLRKCLQDRRIQEHGMMILAKMTSLNEQSMYGGPAIERVSNAVVGVDGISVVLETLTKYYATKRIQADGLATLRNLCYGQETVKMIVHEENGIPIIIEAMDMHLHDEEVVEKAIDLLSSLSKNGSKEIRKGMVKAKAASAVSRAIEEHEDNANIQNVARTAMRKLMV